MQQMRYLHSGKTIETNHIGYIGLSQTFLVIHRLVYFFSLREKLKINGQKKVFFC